MKRSLPCLSLVALAMFLPFRAEGQYQARCNNSTCHGGVLVISPASTYAPTGWPDVVNRMNGYLPISGEPVLTGSEVSQIEAYLEATVPTLTITGPGSLAAGTVGASYGPVQFTRSGVAGSWSWGASGLPTGMSINSSGSLGGIPSVSGSFNPHFTVTDSYGTMKSVSLGLTINSVPPSITSPASLFDGTEGLTYGPVTFTATGGTGGYSWSATGLPNGLSFSTGGVLSGTPASGSQGGYGPQFTVKDSNNATASVSLALNINPALTVLSITGPAFLSAGAEGTAYGPVQFSAVGGSGGYNWTATGLPNGLTINLTTGALSGTPAAGTQGSYSPHFTVKDLSNATASVVLSLTIGAAGQSSAPWISSIPNPVPALNGNQTVTIDGIGFQGGAGLKVRVATGGSTSDLTAPQVSILSPTQLTISINVGLTPANWTAQVINPDGEASNVVAFSVTAQPVNASLAMPQLVFGGGWYTALYFSNTTGATVSVPVTFIGDNGAPLSVPLAGIGPATSRTLSLSPGSTAILEAPNTGGLVQGWAETSLPPGVTGYAVFRQSIAGRADQEAVVPLVSESSQTADLVYDDVNFTTSVSILNPSNQQVIVTMLLYASDGSQIGSGQLVLAARSKQAKALRELPGMAAAAGKRGWVTFSVTQGAVAVIGLRFGGEAFTSIPDTHRSGTMTSLFTAPHVVFGGGWYTALYFANTTTATLTVPVNFFSDTGAPLSVPLTGIGPVSSRTVVLNPGSTAILEAPNTGGLQQGWAEANLPPGVTGYAVFRQSVAGRADQEAVVLLTSESNQTADLVYDDVNFTTSLAVLNPTSQQVTVTIVLYSTNGVQIGSGQLVLAPRSKQANALKDFPGLAAAAGKRGHVTFAVPSGAVAIIGFRFGVEAFTSIPDTFR